MKFSTNLTRVSCEDMPCVIPESTSRWCSVCFNKKDTAPDGEGQVREPQTVTRFCVRNECCVVTH